MGSPPARGFHATRCWMDGLERPAEIPPASQNVDPVAFFFVEQGQFLLLVKIRADERVAALDVSTKVRQRPFLERPENALQALLRFPFQHFEKKRQFGGFHRLRVNVHAVYVVQQNALALGDGEFPAAARRPHQHGLASSGQFVRSCAV